MKPAPQRLRRSPAVRSTGAARPTAPAWSPGRAIWNAPRVAVGVAALLSALCASSRADDAAIGAEIYHENCTACHGRGLVSPGGLAFDLRKFPLDEPERFRQSVLKGTPKGMPAWQGLLSADDVKALWDYLKANR